MKTKEQISAALLEAMRDYQRGALKITEVSAQVAEIAGDTPETCVQSSLNHWLTIGWDSEEQAMLVLAWFALGYQAATEDNNE